MQNNMLVDETVQQSRTSYSEPSETIPSPTSTQIAAAMQQQQQFQSASPTKEIKPEPIMPQTEIPNLDQAPPTVAPAPTTPPTIPSVNSDVQNTINTIPSGSAGGGFGGGFGGASTSQSNSQTTPTKYSIIPLVLLGIGVAILVFKTKKSTN